MVPFLILLIPLLVSSLAVETQITFSPAGGEKILWNSCGPLPLGTREGPLLPPLLLDRNQKRYNSALPDGGYVEWSEAEEFEDGWVDIADPSIRSVTLLKLIRDIANSLYYDRWEALRSTGGWAILQHQIFYQRTLKITSSSIYSFDLTTAAEFSVYRIPTSSDDISTRQWYAGNMYTYPNAVPHYIELVEGDYEITVTYHHDIRIAGEPPNDDSVPSGRWRLLIDEAEKGIRVNERKTITSSIFKGRLMGEVAGVEISNIATDLVEITKITTLDANVSENFFHLNI